MDSIDFLNELKQRMEDKSVDELRELLLYVAKYVSASFYDDVLLSFGRKYAISSKMEGEALLPAIRQLCGNVENGDYEVLWEWYEEDGGAKLCCGSKL